MLPFYLIYLFSLLNLFLYLLPKKYIKKGFKRHDYEYEKELQFQSDY